MKKRLFHILTGRNSGNIAKKRLEFLLIADRAGCTPEILEIHMDHKRVGEKLPVLYASIPVRELLVKGTF